MGSRGSNLSGPALLEILLVGDQQRPALREKAQWVRMRKKSTGKNRMAINRSRLDAWNTGLLHSELNGQELRGASAHTAATAVPVH